MTKTKYEQSPGHPTQAQHRWPPARALVAEDDDELRWLITRTLRRIGLDVVEARDGAALLDRAGEMMLSEQELAGLDLIVSDIRMPGWSGLDALAGLRHSGVGVPVVLITAFGDQQTHEQARRLGATAIVDKPFEMEQLRDIVLQSLKMPERQGARESAPDRGGRNATH